MMGNGEASTPDRDRLRAKLIRYTRNAFRILPDISRPRILDIGCGSGIPTMELAGLSDGRIVALDVDVALLHGLVRDIERAGLSHRISTVGGSMFELPFQNESFDIVWAEGSIARIGFKSGLERWRQLLRCDGFLVVHDETGDIPGKLEQITKSGYELLGHFVLSEDVWWTEYYGPLEEGIRDARARHASESTDPAGLSLAQQEIDAFKRNPKSCASVFFIMQRASVFPPESIQPD